MLQCLGKALGQLVETALHELLHAALRTLQDRQDMTGRGTAVPWTLLKGS